MTKTVQLPPIRIEPEHRDALERISQAMRPAPTLSSLVRQAVLEFIATHKCSDPSSLLSTSVELDRKATP